VNQVLLRDEGGLTISFVISGEVVAVLTMHRSVHEKDITVFRLRQYFGRQKTAHRILFNGIMVDQGKPEILDFWLEQVPDELKREFY
jgi:hypothetical protein